jgi:hypothetical protein
MEEENILQAYVRINNQLIYMISCYDPDYVMQYIKNLNKNVKFNMIEIQNILIHFLENNLQF